MADVAGVSFTHTYAGRELTQELFFQPEEENPSLDSLYRIVDTVDKTNIYLPQKLRKIARKYSTCGFSAAGGTFNLTDKVVSTEKIKVNLEECVDTFDDTIWAETMRTGTDVNDMSGTQIAEMILTQVTKGLRSDLHRIFWFADAGDASSDWNQFDGLISLFVDASSSIGTDCFINMDSTSFESSDALATDGALGLMRQIWEAQNAALRSMNGIFYVTYSVLDNLMTSYEDTDSSLGLSKLVDGQGVARLTFRGKPVVAVPEWDINLADSDNPHYTGNGLSIGSNLIVYTVPENLVIATDSRSMMNNMIKIRNNDDDDEKLKIIAKQKLGAQFIHAELVCIAY